jgi:hypothetical protein
MARTVRLRLNDAGFHAILNGAEVTALVEAAADRIAAQANAAVPKRTNPHGLQPFAVGVHHMPTRVIANVYTQTHDGMRAEVYHRTLSKAL